MAKEPTKEEELDLPVPPEIPLTPGPRGYETPEDTDEFKRSYAGNLCARRKPKALFAMAIGMPEFQGILERPPLSVLKRKELTDLYVPKAEDFKHEIKRRAHFFLNVDAEAAYFVDTLKSPHPLKTKRSNIVLPQPNQWLNTHLKKWLTQRPMKPNDNDIEFLREEIAKAIAYLTKANASDSALSRTAANAAGGVDASGPSLASPLMGTPAGSMLEKIDATTSTYSNVADTEEFKRSAAATFLQREQKPRVLLAVALGMPQFKGIFEKAPFALIKRKDLSEDFIPRAEDFRFEIKRRAHFFMNVDEELHYYTRDLKKKNPLENMRGIVAIPQPNQWKLHALKAWLAERPMKPHPQDDAFLKETVSKFVDALNQLIEDEPQMLDSPFRKLSKAVLFSDPMNEDSDDEPPMERKKRDSLLIECINKQDIILNAVTTQTQQQTILNKISVLNQAITSYQQEMSSVRSSINDIENRILNVEIRIAENPDATEKLQGIIAKQQEKKDACAEEIKGFEQLIAEARTKIEEHSTEMTALAEKSAEDSGPPSKKIKLDSGEEAAAEATAEALVDAVAPQDPTLTEV